jgi:hypothetical protein
MKKNNNNAFTLIEMLLVVSLSIIFIVAFFWIWSNSYLEWRSIERLTYRDIDFNVNSACNNSIIWYGGVSIWEWVKDEKRLLPEEFMVFFRSSLDNDITSGYFFNIQLQNREDWNITYTRIIQNTEMEYKAPSIFLKTITWKVDESDSWNVLQSVWISFINPTCKTMFFTDNLSFINKWTIVLSEDSINTINEFIQPVENTTYNIIELDYYWNDWKKKFTYVISKDKEFYVK